MDQQETQPASLSPLTIRSADIQNFKRLRVAHLHFPTSGVIPVRGRNRQGKSSAIDALASTLFGSKATPELPITEGEHGANVMIDLGDVIVRKKWKRDSAGVAKPLLTVEEADGARLPSPQAVLDSFVGYAADPVAFIGMKPADQVKTVLGVLGLNEELERLEARVAGAFEKRRDLGRDADRAKKAAEAMREGWEKERAQKTAALPAVAPELAEMTPEQLDAKLAECQAHNNNIEHVKRARDAAKEKGGAAVQGAAIARREIEELREKIALLEIDAQHLDGVAEAQRAIWIERNEYLHQFENGALVDLTPIRAALVNVGATQAARERELQVARVETDAREAERVHAIADAELEAARDVVAKLLASTQFPVPGMAYDAEHKLLTVNGIPLSQASQSEQIEIAANVVMAGGSRLRLLFVRDASLMDDETMLRLDEIAHARGYQVVAEVVASKKDADGGATKYSVWISDGEAEDVGA